MGNLVVTCLKIKKSSYQRLRLVVELHFEVVPLVHVSQQEGLGQGEVGVGAGGHLLHSGRRGGVVPRLASSLLSPGTAANRPVDEYPQKFISAKI